MIDKLKLLIIEDDEKIRSVLVTILEEANFDVTHPLTVNQELN